MKSLKILSSLQVYKYEGRNRYFVDNGRVTSSPTIFSMLEVYLFFIPWRNLWTLLARSERLVWRVKNFLTSTASASVSKLPLELEHQMKYYCWRMIKLDPHLQHAIVEDTDGYFRDVFPQSMDEYLVEYAE